MFLTRGPGKVSPEVAPVLHPRAKAHELSLDVHVAPPAWQPQHKSSWTAGTTVPLLETRTPFDVAPFWKASSCAGHVPGQASNLVLASKLQHRPRVYKSWGVGWRGDAQCTTFLVPDDALTGGLFVEPELSYN